MCENNNENNRLKVPARFSHAKESLAKFTTWTSKSLFDRCRKMLIKLVSWGTRVRITEASCSRVKPIQAAKL